MLTEVQQQGNALQTGNAVQSAEEPSAAANASAVQNSATGKSTRRRLSRFARQIRRPSLVTKDALSPFAGTPEGSDLSLLRKTAIDSGESGPKELDDTVKSSKGEPFPVQLIASKNSPSIPGASSSPPSVVSTVRSIGASGSGTSTANARRRICRLARKIRRRFDTSINNDPGSSGSFRSASTPSLVPGGEAGLEERSQDNNINREFLPGLSFDVARTSSGGVIPSPSSSTSGDSMSDPRPGTGKKLKRGLSRLAGKIRRQSNDRSNSCFTPDSSTLDANASASTVNIIMGGDPPPGPIENNTAPTSGRTSIDSPPPDTKNAI